MKIRSVSSMLLSVPTDQHIGDSLRQFDAAEVLAVYITSDEGQTGLGITYSVDVGGRSMKDLVDDYLAPILVGKDPFATEGIFKELWWRSHSVGRRGLVVEVLSAIDIALWDLKGKALGQPVRNLLGTCRDRIPVYGSDGGWLSLTAEQVADQAKRYVFEMGMPGVKMKVGCPDIKEDMRRVAKVREAVGPEIKLMVDANQAWRASQALEAAKRLAQFDLEWLEEPLPADDVAGHAFLQQQGVLPVAVGETLYSVWDFYEYVRQGAAAVFQHDIGRVGGVTHWMKVSHLAEAAHLPVAPHFMMEQHVQVLMCTTSAVWLEYIPWLQKLYTEPLKIVDGNAYAPDGPGMGLELSPRAVELYRVR